MRDGIFRFAKLPQPWKKAFDALTRHAHYAGDAAALFHNAVVAEALQVDAAAMRELKKLLTQLPFQDDIEQAFRSARGGEANCLERDCLRLAAMCAGGARPGPADLTAGIAKALRLRIDGQVAIAEAYAAIRVRKGELSADERMNYLHQGRNAARAVDVAGMADTIARGGAILRVRRSRRLGDASAALPLGRAAVAGIGGEE